MRIRTGLIAASVVAAAALVSTPGSSQEADGQVFFPFPFFTPIADCGTIDWAQGFYDFDGDGEPDDCLAWFADSGGAYIMAGLDAFDVGDRVFVEGDICNTCLTTCAAGAIFSPTFSACSK